MSVCRQEQAKTPHFLFLEKLSQLVQRSECVLSVPPQFVASSSPTLRPKQNSLMGYGQQRTDRILQKKNTMAATQHQIAKRRIERSGRQLNGHARGTLRALDNKQQSHLRSFVKRLLQQLDVPLLEESKKTV